MKSLTYTAGGETKPVPEFNSGVVSDTPYSVVVSSEDVDNVKIAAEGIANAGSTVVYGGDASADGTVTFSNNAATATVTVTSQDTSVTKVYTINFTVDTTGELVNLIFEDDFEGYGDLTVPNTSKWSQVYGSNVKLEKESDNTYLSIFPTTERYPRIAKYPLEIETDKTLHFSGKVMLVAGTNGGNPTANIEIRDKTNYKD